jgi:hypothetical protein
MSFPTSPTNGQAAVVNNITYSYSTASNAWLRSTQSLLPTQTTSTFFVNNTTSATSTSTGALQVTGGVGIGGNVYFGGIISGNGVRTTTTSTAPTSAGVGDIWYDSSTDTTYRYTYDGTTNYWIDIGGPSQVNTVITATWTGGTITSALTITNVTAAISTVSGALQVSGGVGIGGSLYVGGSVVDAAGDLRSIPQNAQTSSYTLIATDPGKHVAITTGGVTVPSGVYSAGSATTVFNNSTASQTITQGSGVTLRWAGSSSTGNRTLASYGLCTILCVASNTFVISGAGLS